MLENICLTFENAKNQIDDIMKSLNKSTRENLISYAAQKWLSLVVDDDENICNSDSDDTIDDPIHILNSVVEYIRPKVPISGVLPSEKLLPPRKGENSVADAKTSIYVDAFLYSDDELNELEANGKITTHYCGDCGSNNTKLLSTFTHSFSRDDLYCIFNTILPTLNGKTVLDVGSRLGAVLYGACVFTDAAKIIGIEMNEDFCKLQNEIVKKFHWEKRVEIINKRIEEIPEILINADVIILNNVFEFFLPENEQINVWNYLKKHTKKGAYIVSRPQIKTSIDNINHTLNIDEWIKKIDVTDVVNQSKNLFDTRLNNDNNDIDRLSDIACYKVL